MTHLLSDRLRPDSARLAPFVFSPVLCSLFSSFLLLAACYSFYSANKEVTLSLRQRGAPVLVSGEARAARDHHQHQDQDTVQTQMTPPLSPGCISPVPASLSTEILTTTSWSRLLLLLSSDVFQVLGDSIRSRAGLSTGQSLPPGPVSMCHTASWCQNTTQSISHQ